jgi:hypothetical protein
MVIVFVTSPNLLECAKYLDKKRVWKQAVEARQIIDAIDNPGSSKWENHPCAKSWKNHSDALKVYYNYILRECLFRGINTTMQLYDIDENEYSVIPTYFEGNKTTLYFPTTNKTFPPFFSWYPFIMSHRAALIRKNPDYYYTIFYTPEIEPYLSKGYIWPCNLPKDVFNYFDYSMITEMGSGTPSYFRLNIDNIKKWVQNQNINPTTGREIKSTGNIYKDYYSAAKYYKFI